MFQDEDGFDVRAADILTDDQLNSTYTYKWFDLSQMPIFLGQALVIFEGNASILNVYS